MARLIAAKSWEAVCMEAKGNHYMETAKDEMEKINKSEEERYLYLRREMEMCIRDRVHTERLWMRDLRGNSLLKWEIGLQWPQP